MTAKKGSFDPQVIATTCMSVVETTLNQMCGLGFSQDPSFVQRDIIEYGSRMRVFGMEIFNGPAYISAISYYFSQKHLEAHDACGVFILYVNDTIAERLLSSLGFGKVDEDDQQTMLDTCGEFCNILAGNFKNELAQLGYLDLVLSAPSTFRNGIPDGVEFSYDEYIKYETSFYFWKEKAMAVDITLSPLPEKK